MISNRVYFLSEDQSLKDAISKANSPKRKQTALYEFFGKAAKNRFDSSEIHV